MNWQNVISLAIGCATLLGVVWKIGAAWTKNAIAIGEKAEAERQKLREIQELRESHAKFMARMQTVEETVKEFKVRDDERRQYRRDTRGVPVTPEE